MTRKWEDDCNEYEDYLERICKEALGLRESYGEGLDLPSDEELRNIINIDNLIEKKRKDMTFGEGAAIVSSIGIGCGGMCAASHFEKNSYNYLAFGSYLLGSISLMCASLMTLRYIRNQIFRREN